MLIEAKADYYINLIEKTRRDTRTLWTALREISLGSTTTSVMSKLLKSVEFETSNPCDIADTFNQFFSTIADAHAPRDNHMPESEFLTLSEHVRTKLVEGSTFVIPNVDLEYVPKRLSTQPNKSYRNGRYEC